MSGMYPPNGQPPTPPNGQQPYPTNGPPQYRPRGPYQSGPPFPPNGRPPFPPGGQPPFMQGPPPPPARRGNGFATASLVLGILALLFAFASAPALAVLLGILALIFGLISLRNRTGRGIAGTIMGSGGLVIAIALGMVNLASSDDPIDASEQVAVDPGAESDTGAVSVPDVTGESVADARALLEKAGLEVASPGAGSDDEVSGQSPAAGSAVEPGSTVTLEAASPAGSSVTHPAKAGTKFGMDSWGRAGDDDPDYRIWFDGYNGNQTSTDSWDAPDAGMKYVTVVVHVEALQSGVHTGIETWDVNLTDKKGKVYEETYLSGVEDIPSVTLGKGQSSSGRLAFEVPNDFDGGVLSFADATIFVRTN